jgi:NTE family protein
MNKAHTVSDAAAPVTEFDEIVAEERQAGPQDGIGLCLSGGGYRAMLFHVGVIVRLNEAKLLPKLKRVSSVSGGSITAGVLGLNWSNLNFVDDLAENLDEQLVSHIRKMAATTIDRGSIVGGILAPGSISDRIAAAYDRHLFHGATLQALPADSAGPRFVINATSVQTGALVRLSRPYVADYKVGMILNPEVPLADAVAASSAFPPFLSPFTIDVEPSDFADQPRGPLHHEPYTEELVLSDGGVYDNLGLETVWKRYKSVLVSDGGGQMKPDDDPSTDWARHSKRILDVIDNQVRSLRKRQLILGFINSADPHDGAYWGIRTNIDDYGLPQTLPCPHGATLTLAETPTRLKRLSTRTQNRLMNWGYAVCDAAIRAHFSSALPANFTAPSRFPFDHGVG